MIKGYLYFILILLFLESCQTQRTKEIQETVLEWQGKEIRLPEEMKFFKYATEESDAINLSTDYKILCYVDSTGCVHCKWKLIDWNQFMKYSDSISNHNVSFLFVVNNSDRKKLRNLLREEMFDYPIYLDTADIVNKMNKFPKNEQLRTFLLDRDNKVVLLGNPVLSKSIESLYIKTILSGRTQP